MPTKIKTKALVIAVNVCRLLLAATFIFSGFVKANDPLGTMYKLQDYVNAMSSRALPDTFLLGCAVMLAFFEFTIGIYTLFGIDRKKTSGITLAFMVVMTILTVYIVVANPVSDCGCFGDALVLSNEATLAKNIVLLAAAILTYRYYRLQFNFIGPVLKWFIVFVSLCFIIGYAVYCIICQPVLDFRPYKIGTNLRETVAGTSETPQYDVRIIYEKDGKTLELTAEDEDPDSTWTYVETRRTPLEETHTATADFYVMNAENEDITEDILFADGYTFLLIIPSLTNADEGCIDRVNEVYGFAKDHGLGFYCITSLADQHAQTYWNDHTGAEYDYYTSDDRELKTIVRGEPGLVLLHDGVITHKWSNYNMPNEKDLTEKYGILTNDSTNKK